eukprot:UN2616
MSIFATNSSTICTRMAILILRHYCHKYSHIYTQLMSIIHINIIIILLIL